MLKINSEYNKEKERYEFSVSDLDNDIQFAGFMPEETFTDVEAGIGKVMLWLEEGINEINRISGDEHLRELLLGVDKAASSVDKEDS